MRRQRGFTILVYGLVALAILAVLSGIAYKIRESGYDACVVKWDESNAKATAKAEEDRQKQELLSRTQAKTLEETLAKLRTRKRAQTTVVETHIVQAAIPLECRVSDSLRDDINRAADPKDDASGKLPAGSGITPPALRPNPPGAR